MKNIKREVSTLIRGLETGSKSPSYVRGRLQEIRANLVRKDVGPEVVRAIDKTIGPQVISRQV